MDNQVRFGDNATTTKYLNQPTGSGSGVAGPAGPVGPVGPAGPAGQDGADGADGAQGIQGVDGVQGSPGQDGPQGPIGPAGPTGPQGDQGVAGEQGPQGPIGPVGPAGPVGPIGLNFRGQYVSGEAYLENDLVSYQGAAYFAILDNTGGNPPPDSPSWALFVSQGATGPQGPIGPQGLDGPTGDQGPIGPAGPAGPQGEQGIRGLEGIAGPIGPQGLPGERGAEGPQGEQGERGREGPIGLTGPTGPVGPEGPRGFKGDQGEKGEKGDPGIEGPIGPQGEQGIQGEDGAQGIPGPTGPQGEQGPTGADGIEGPQGPQGLQGDVGPQGPQGIQGEKGDKGDKGDQGEAGPAGLTFRGLWDADTDYVTNDAVSFQGSSYFAIQDNKNSVPLSGTTTGIASFLSGGVTPNDQNIENLFDGDLTTGIIIDASATESVNIHLVGLPVGVDIEFFMGVGTNFNGFPVTLDGVVVPLPPAGSQGFSSPLTTTENMTLSFLTTDSDALIVHQVRVDGVVWDGVTTILASDAWALLADQGAKGDDGAPGADGSDGAQGPTGPQGEQGEVGPVGPQGEQGPKGDQGEQGVAGEQGIQGETGPQGLQGEQGPVGPRGEQGPAGQPGPTGAAGPVGPQGDPGSTIFTGLVDTPDILEPTKLLAVNSTGDEIVMIDQVTSIDNLDDVQTDGSGHDPADGDALVWNESHGHWMPGEVSTSSSFVELPDTPGSFEADKYLKVNSDGTGLEYASSSPADSAGMLGSHFKVEELNNLGARIPDAIIMSVGNPNSSTGPAHFYLRHVQSLYIEYVDPMKSDQYIRFRNQPGGAEYKKGTTRLYYSSQNTLQSIIDEGYAIYLGGSDSEPSTSRVGQLQEVIDNVPLASSVELPDAILDYDLGSSTVSRILFFEKVQNSDHFQYKNQDGAGISDFMAPQVV